MRPILQPEWLFTVGVVSGGRVDQYHTYSSVFPGNHLGSSPRP